MKRLFVLKQYKSGPVVLDSTTNQPLYFANKQEAKKIRDSLGGNTVVSYGPDHRLYTR